MHHSNGILTVCTSLTHQSDVRLRSDLPAADWHCCGNLGLSASTNLTWRNHYLCQHSHSIALHGRLHFRFVAAIDAPLPRSSEGREVSNTKLQIPNNIQYSNSNWNLNIESYLWTWNLNIELSCPSNEHLRLRYLVWAPIIFGAEFPNILVSCYALFKGWLLLSQPPSCIRNSTTFSTKLRFRNLRRESGMFPSRPYQLIPAGLTPVDICHSIRSLVDRRYLAAPAIIQ